MNGFEEYLDKMGYSWNDFDRPYEVQNLIEQYADEKVSQALSLHNVSQQRELIKAFDDWCDNNEGELGNSQDVYVDKFFNSL